jgi:hypothetical protein
MANQWLAPATPGIYDDIVNGTCELDQAYGTVISGELDDGEDLERVRGCNGNVSAVLLRDDEQSYTFTALFPSTVTKPAKGTNIPFPSVAGSGIQGQVVNSKVNWTREGQRSITIKAIRWAALGNAPTVVSA